MCRKFHWLFLVGMLFCVTLIPACDCGPEPGVRCSNDDECPDDQICIDALCKPRIECGKGKKCPGGRVCLGGYCREPQCSATKKCPEGEVCDNGICVKKKADQCVADSECKNPKICCDLGNGKGNQCNFKRCLVDEDCVAGQSKNTCAEPVSCLSEQKAVCSQGVCKCESPCGGADCGSSKCCDVKKDLCVDNPKPCPGLSCPPGFDPPAPGKFTINSKNCEITGPKCECVKREPLALGIVGEHSEIAISGGKAVISAYNKTYGDLMVGTRASDGKIDWAFVDGVPASGTPTGAVDGPRGGVSDKGDDVGLFTSIAVSADGTVHVAYHDKTNKALKYATNKGGKWATHVVDKVGTGVGRYTSITVSGNLPVIAYMVANDGKDNSSLRLARANVPNPSADSDWKILPVVSAKLPACAGKCKKDEVCAKNGANFVCLKPTADADKCSPKACAADKQACVNGKCLDTVADNAYAELPAGTGLFSSIAPVAGGGVVVTFYDNLKKDLLVVLQEKAGAAFKVRTLKSTGDVGSFSSVAVGPKRNFHVSYIGEDGNLRYLRLRADLSIEWDELVDDGFSQVTSGGEDHLLSDSSIAVDNLGVPRIVYQDATTQSLMVAVRTGTKQWKLTKLVAGDLDGKQYKGSYGFFADQVLLNGTSLISNFRVDIRTDSKKDLSGIDVRTWRP